MNINFFFVSFAFLHIVVSLWVIQSKNCSLSLHLTITIESLFSWSSVDVHPWRCSGWCVPLASAHVSIRRIPLESWKCVYEEDELRWWLVALAKVSKPSMPEELRRISAAVFGAANSAEDRRSTWLDSTRYSRFVVRVRTCLAWTWRCSRHTWLDRSRRRWHSFSFSRHQHHHFHQFTVDIPFSLASSFDRIKIASPLPYNYYYYLTTFTF